MRSCVDWSRFSCSIFLLWALGIFYLRDSSVWPLCYESWITFLIILFTNKQTDRQMSMWLFCFFFNPFYKSSSFDLSITYGQHNIIAIVFFFLVFFSHILDFPSPDFAASAWYRPQPQQYWFEDWFCFQFALPSHIISASDILYIIQVRHKYYCIIICHYHSVSLWFLLLFNRVLLEDFSPFFCPLWAWFKATTLEGFCTFAVFWPRLLA